MDAEPEAPSRSVARAYAAAGSVAITDLTIVPDSLKDPSGRASISPPVWQYRSPRRRRQRPENKSARCSIIHPEIRRAFTLGFNRLRFQSAACQMRSNVPALTGFAPVRRHRLRIVACSSPTCRLRTTKIIETNFPNARRKRNSASSLRIHDSLSA